MDDILETENPERFSLGLTVLDDIKEREKFLEVVGNYYRWTCRQVSCEPEIKDRLLKYAADAYAREINSMKSSLPQESKKLDHFKSCGVLTYWLRRFAPIVGIHSRTDSFKETTNSFALLLRRYPAELLALEIGLTICERYHGSEPPVNHEWYQEMCYLMRFKSVSPHSMGMIYRSLFLSLPDSSAEPSE